MLWLGDEVGVTGCWSVGPWQCSLAQELPQMLNTTEYLITAVN